jgi:hypothetical protein
MNLSDEVDLEDYVSRPDKISAADVSLFSQWVDGFNTCLMLLTIDALLQSFYLNVPTSILLVMHFLFNVNAQSTFSFITNGSNLVFTSWLVMFLHIYNLFYLYYLPASVVYMTCSDDKLYVASHP